MRLCGKSGMFCYLDLEAGRRRISLVGGWFCFLFLIGDVV